ncbi:MAG: META domain-containing protein [Thermodesulfobacteriota bacterium]
MNRRLLCIFLLLLFAAFCGEVAAGTEKKASIMSSINVDVLYLERIMLPPGAEVIVTMEDTARMDVAAEMIAENRMFTRGGPPFHVTLEYDSARIQDKGIYTLRAVIRVQGQLLYTSTESIGAFDNSPGEAVEIVVSRVARSNPSGPKPDSSLINTYWKVISIHGKPVSIGAGGTELHMILRRDKNSVKGFSGCNNFIGTYEQTDTGLLFKQMISTMKACLKSMEQERLFLDALDKVRSYLIKGETMTLQGEKGKPLIRLHAVYLQ